jgi:hypothetical protein
MYNLSALDSLVPGADARDLRATLHPGIVGLFVQGLEIGLVLAQLSSWLSFPECTESRLVVTLTVFVTTVGLWASCHSCLSISLLLIVGKVCRGGFALLLLGGHTWNNLGNRCVALITIAPRVHIVFQIDSASHGRWP